ncbi:MAG: YegS/Rv2252/BmrU family lipid kinase [Planctomycetes bacterium]|nr:YegS/Rv2252/BmrU family lipid kinase [Planctomycetota bacterium]
MQKRVHVVVNPISGRRRSRAGARAFLKRVDQSYSAVTTTETKGSGDAALAAAAACSEEADALIVVGGDGTVREAASGMTGKGVPILIVPCGTENVVAKYLGLRIDGDLLLRVLTEGNRLEFDFGVCNHRKFLFVCGVGYDAEVVRVLAAKRTGHISYFTYVTPLLKSLIYYRPPRLRVKVDGRAVFEGMGQVILGNISRYAFGMKILSRAQPNDGLLDVCIFEYKRRIRLLWHAIRVVANRHLPSKGVHYHQGRRIRVECDESAPVELDGDVAGTTPIDIGLDTRRIAFLTPI